MQGHNQFQEQPKTLQDYTRIILGGKLWVVFFTFFVFAFSVYKTFSTAPTYQSDAVIMIEDKSQAAAVFNFGDRMDSKAIANEIQIIKSRYVAEELVTALWESPYKNNLYLFGTRKFKPRGQRYRRWMKEIVTLGFWEPKPDTTGQIGEILTEDLLAEFTKRIRNNISVSYREKTNILDISITSVGKDEVELLVDNFIQVYQRIDKQWGAAELTNMKTFLAEQLEKKEKELRIAEDKVRKYQETQKIFSVDKQYSPLLDQLTAAEAQYYNSEAEISIAKNRKQFLENQLSEEEKTLTSKLKSSINARLTALRHELSQKEAELIRSTGIYGENHDAVKNTKRDIGKIKDQLEKETNLLISQGISVADPLKYSQDLIEKVLQAEAEIAGLATQRDEFKKLVEKYNEQIMVLPEKQLNFARLDRNRFVLDEIYRLMRTKMEEASITEASEAGKVRIIDDASRAYKISPNVKQDLMLGLIMGLGLGVAFVLFRDYLDNTLKSLEEIERTGLSILGVIPDMSKNNKGKYARHKKQELKRQKKNGKEKQQKNEEKEGYPLITHYDPKSPISEAFRTIRTNITMTSPDKTIKSVLITSPGPSEGKTTCISNLAITFANLGKRTLVIDADLRRSNLHKQFRTKRAPGLVQYLTGKETDFSKLIIESEVKNLYIVPSGGMPPNPSELLGSQKMTDLIGRLEQEWDMVLVDSPPIVAVTDSTMISKEIDEIILVTRSRQTDRHAFIRAINILKQVESPLGGVIMNGVSKASSYDSYYYYYQYYYYTSDQEGSEHKKKKKFSKRLMKKLFN